MSQRKHPRRRRGRKKKQAARIETTSLATPTHLELVLPSVAPPPTATLSLSTVRSRLQSLNQRRAAGSSHG